MQKTKLLTLGLLIILVLSATGCACKCPSGTCPAGTSCCRTSGNDEYRRVSDAVLYQANSYATWTQVPSDSCWRGFPSGSSLKTDPNGEGELSLSSCSDLLYFFMDTSLNFKVETCNKVQYTSTTTPSGTCVSNGAVLATGCSSEFFTGSGIVTKISSTFALIALPEPDNITIVVVLDGEVQLKPVTAFEPTQFDKSIQVPVGDFVYTMPDSNLKQIQDLSPRQVYTYADLTKLLPAYPLVKEWLTDVYIRAHDLGIYPKLWPQELGGEAVQQPAVPIISFELNGNQVGDPALQEIIFSAVNWQGIKDNIGLNLDYRVRIGEQMVTPLGKFNFNPGQTRQALAEHGFPEGIVVTLLTPTEDSELGTIAELMIVNLNESGIKANHTIVPASDFDASLQSMLQAGGNLITMKR